MSRESRLHKWLTIAEASNPKPSGDNIIAHCPFHEDSNRSFSISMKTGQFLCFSESCGASGGLVTFLTQKVGYSLSRALKLADEFEKDSLTDIDGWTLLPAWSARGRAPVEFNGKDPLPEWRADLYKELCSNYLVVKRGFKRSVLREWEVGFAERSEEHAESVVFCVRDRRGALRGFSFRPSYDDPNGAKYVHFEFPRSAMLYGQHRATNAREVWVGEGQLDCLALYQLGVPHPLSTMGGKVSRNQIALLSSFQTVVLAYDADATGVAATWRIGHGLLRASGSDVYVARRFPKGASDPGDIVRHRLNPGPFLDRLERFSTWKSKLPETVLQSLYRKARKDMRR